MKQPRLSTLAATGAVAALTSALYLPFLGNPMIFDDLSFFSGSSFAYHATTPFGLNLRLLPYFSLAFPQVMWGSYRPWNHAEIHRLISLGLHIACTVALYKLLYELQLAVASTRGLGIASGNSNASTTAFIGTAFFALHPVAVYGVAYLVQRTIILATLFSLLSILFFVHGMLRGRYWHALSAAACYSLAVFSKEHSLLIPAVVSMTVPLIARDWRFAARYTGAYLVACLPAAVAVVLLVRGVIGRAYEPGIDMLLAQIEGIPHLDVARGPWLVSAVTQAGLFYKYLAVWLVPDTGAMSIDVRIDFAETWSAGWIALKTAGYVAFGMLGLFLLCRRGNVGLIGFGLLYFWILFAVELSSARFQEPFVLYRSYLWAPGIIIAVVSVLSLAPRSLALALFVLVGPVLLYQAHDRLRSFSSALALWEDAAAKLPQRPIPWGSRTLFGLAGEQVYTGQWQKALQTADRCIAQYPNTSYCYFSRGAIHLYREEYEEALTYIERSLAIHEKSGIAHHHRGYVMEKLGRLKEAKADYRRAYELGFMGGLYRLNMLDRPGKGPRTLYEASTSRKKTD